jgi:hypothetical protein
MTSTKTQTFECADVDKRRSVVEVIMPDPELGVVGSSSVPALASSAPTDGSSLAKKAIAKLPPEIAEQAKDPKRKAKSKDLGCRRCK